MTNETNTIPAQELADFSAEFFEASKEAAAPKQTKEEVSPEEEAPEIEAVVDDEDSELLEEDESATKPKLKKNRFQERIDKVTEDRRAAERLAEERQARIEELEAKLAKEAETFQASKSSSTNNGEPQPDDEDKDGNPKYPLGEFDPAYTKDLISFVMEQKRLEQQVELTLKAKQEEQEKEREALQSGWQSQVEAKLQEYPDFNEKGEELVDALSSVNQEHADYLANVIMGMDHGADVFYYLSSNPDLALNIASKNAIQATIMLGNIEARFQEAQAKKTLAKPRVSSAPKPPSAVNKGTAVASNLGVSDDDEPLSVFASKFFGQPVTY